MGIENYKDEKLVDLTEVSVYDLLPKDTLHFWRYDGSLTTPDFDESVVWTVMQEKVKVPSDFFFYEHKKSSLRLVRDKEGTPTDNNWREVQPLNGRTVWANKGAEG